MTNYSKADLRDSAMEAIGVKDVEESLSATDAARANDLMQQMIEGLEDESLLIFDSSVAVTVENIPGRIFLALKDMLAETAAPHFGKEPRTVQRPGMGPEPLYDAALRRLRRSVLDGSDDTPVKACYF